MPARLPRLFVRLVPNTTPQLRRENTMRLTTVLSSARIIFARHKPHIVKEKSGLSDAEWQRFRVNDMSTGRWCTSLTTRFQNVVKEDIKKIPVSDYARRDQEEVRRRLRATLAVKNLSIDDSLLNWAIARVQMDRLGTHSANLKRSRCECRHRNIGLWVFSY